MYSVLSSSNAMGETYTIFTRKINGFFLDPPLLRLHLVVFSMSTQKILIKTTQVPQKLNIDVPFDLNNSTSSMYSQIIGSMGSRRYLYVKDHNSIIHNIQKVEVTPVSNQQMNG